MYIFIFWVFLWHFCFNRFILNVQIRHILIKITFKSSLELRPNTFFYCFFYYQELLKTTCRCMLCVSFVQENVYSTNVPVVVSDGHHLEWRVGLSDTILKGNHPRTILATFGLIWLSSSREDLNVIFIKICLICTFSINPTFNTIFYPPKTHHMYI
jgi:hypothetical protein